MCQLTVDVDEKVPGVSQPLDSTFKTEEEVMDLQETHHQYALCFSFKARGISSNGRALA